MVAPLKSPSSNPPRVQRSVLEAPRPSEQAPRSQPAPDSVFDPNAKPALPVAAAVSEQDQQELRRHHERFQLGDSAAREFITTARDGMVPNVNSGSAQEAQLLASMEAAAKGAATPGARPPEIRTEYWNPWDMRYTVSAESRDFDAVVAAVSAAVDSRPL